MLWELPGITLQKVRDGDVHTYYVYGYKVDEELAGRGGGSSYAAAGPAEGRSDVIGPYIRGMPLYRYPVFAEERTYGSSRYPFVDEEGNRRIDYNTLRLPVVEEELTKTNGISFRGYSEDEARDIAGAIRKVALHYLGKR